MSHATMSPPGAQQPRQHQFDQHRNCGLSRCFVCSSGLRVCMTCGCFDRSLPTECPGEQVLLSHGEQIVRGEIDYRNGAWTTVVGAEA